ncbi:MAG TPA: hypothetical protein VN688_18260, partial [Gemmataceae bacterium]|nr:hypothetical protein [Gemmataceae bacterium]
MKNGWTGGQYSLFRVVFALCLGVHFLRTLPESTGLAAALRALAVVLSLLFGIGLYDRVAALGLCCIGTVLLGRGSLVVNADILFAGWLLLAHVFLPPAPYGSWAARGRIDPGGGWRMLPVLFAAAWIVLALGYSYNGYMKLVSPSWGDGTTLSRVGMGTALTLELAFAPLALVPRLRPWLWSAMLFIYLPLIALFDFADLSLGLVMLQLFT